jgi:hypothetical protein
LGRSVEESQSFAQGVSKTVVSATVSGKWNVFIHGSYLVGVPASGVAPA